MDPLASFVRDIRPGSLDNRNATSARERRRPTDVQASFANLGIEHKLSTRQEFACFIADDVPRWAAIVKLTGTKTE